MTIYTLKYIQGYNRSGPWKPGLHAIDMQSEPDRSLPMKQGRHLNFFLGDQNFLIFSMPPHY